MEFEFTTSIWLDGQFLEWLKYKKISSREKFDDILEDHIKCLDDMDYYSANLEFFDKVWEWYQKNRKNP